MSAYRTPPNDPLCPWCGALWELHFGGSCPNRPTHFRLITLPPFPVRKNYIKIDLSGPKSSPGFLDKALSEDTSNNSKRLEDK